MGFNTEGAVTVATRLERVRKSGRWPGIPVGINLGKSKVTPLDEAPDDYLASLRALKSFGDYFVINVSSPNTPGLRDLQETSRLAEIMAVLRTEAPDKPILVKIAPDLSDEGAIEIAALAEKAGLAGLISTNTTLDHSTVLHEGDQQGGLSGAPLLARSTSLTRLLSASTPLPIVASGGIMDADSANQKFAAGAKLIQLYTGFVYHGPPMIAEILKKYRSPKPEQ
jgi:dihydroorotate dehydrogenase